VRVTDVGGYVEFVAREREYEQENKVAGGRTSSKESIFEENLKLEVEGYSYHPNFVEFAAGGLFGLVQRGFEDVFGNEVRTSRDDGSVVEFDVQGSFFKKKDYPGMVYARRYRALEPRPFRSSLEVTTSNYGVTWRYINEKTPVSLQFTHSDVELDPGNDFEAKGQRRTTRLRFDTAYKFNDHNVLSFLYDRESLDEQPFELSYDTDELTLSHMWGFGDRYRYQLESEVNHYNQQGSFSIERTRWREHLRIDHSETLRSLYLFELLDRRQGNLAGVPSIDERSYTGTAMIEHQLYLSLLSRLAVFGQLQEFNSGLDIERYGIEGTFDYRKKNRWGLLMANCRTRYRTEDHRGGEFQVEILDERQTFQDPEPAVLNSSRVSTGTIFITAEDRTTVYRISDDYTVHLVGDLTEIRRVPTGRILDGETVLIDYLSTIGGSFDLDTFQNELALRQKFDFGLTPYYRFTRQDQRLTPSDATGVTPDDITAHIIGVEYERGSLNLKAEYEDHDSTITPFKATRLSARYSRRFESGAAGMMRARLTAIDRGAPNDRKTTFFTLEGEYRHPITRTLSVEGIVAYRNEDDSITGDDEGIEVDLALDWDIRQTDVKITYEFAKYRDDFADNESSNLFVRIRRKF